MALVSIPDFLKEVQSYGWSTNASLGILGNVLGEANSKKIGGQTFLDAGSIERAPTSKGVGVGLFQYTSPDRKAAFEKIIGKSVNNSTWQEQIRFMDYELNNHPTYKKVGDVLKANPTVNQALSTFLRKFEIPKNVDSEEVRRTKILSNILTASNYYKKFSAVGEAASTYMQLNHALAQNVSESIKAPLSDISVRVGIALLGALLLTLGLQKLKV